MQKGEKFVATFYSDDSTMTTKTKVRITQKIVDASTDRREINAIRRTGNFVKAT